MSSPELVMSSLIHGRVFQHLARPTCPAKSELASGSSETTALWQEGAARKGCWTSSLTTAKPT
eukprot:408282-Alexandrium_andersonii.AAC.1